MQTFQALLDSKLKEWSVKEDEEGFDLPFLFSFFMQKYGMSFEEVKEMKLNTAWGLLNAEKEIRESAR